MSYSTRDSVAVRALVEDLERARQQVWMDQDLGGGDTWWAEILQQIRECAVFVFALSDSSLRSKPCRAELEYAQALGLPVLPVQIGHVSSYRTDSVFTRQLVDYRDFTSRSGIALIAALHERADQRADLPDPLPEPPPIPFEYLVRLGAAIRGMAELTPAAQASMVFELRHALADEEDPSVLNDVRELLRILRRRRDATHAIVGEIDAMLRDSNDTAPPGQSMDPGRQEKPETSRAQEVSDPPETTPPAFASMLEAVEEATIESMAFGAEGFTVPWAMWVDTERRCWLKPEFTLRERAGGTVQMRVARQQDGYHVWIPTGATWSLDEGRVHSDLPVKRLYDINASPSADSGPLTPGPHGFASLPEGVEEPTIERMATGDVGYTVPWAMWVDGERRCWLKPSFTLRERPGGTAQLRVARQDDGYHVWVPAGETWTVEHGSAHTDVPVAQLHR